MFSLTCIKQAYKAVTTQSIMFESKRRTYYNQHHLKHADYLFFKDISCFIYFHYKSNVDNDMPGAWPVWTPGAPLAAFIKERIIHWSTQHMKALGHMVSEKKIFLCFSHDAPRAGPVWTPGAQLAVLLKRTTIHC